MTNSEGYDIVVGDVTSATASTELQLRAMQRDGTLDSTIRSLDADGASNDSAAILGMVTLSGDKPFTIKPGVATNHFAANANEISSTLSTLGNINLKTVSGATNAIAVIDGALAMVSASRSKMGAIQNRLNSTVENLSTIITKTEQSRSRVLDADFATETTALSKSQILSQASTAMLAQANQANQGVLQLLQA
jgi:flagellin